MKPYSRDDQRLLARWAIACTERVLPFFTARYPDDPRPRQALDACRAWITTEQFHMATIRAASLGAHAAARQALGHPSACFTARAAGHAVATAHVPQHAYGAAYYALKAIAAADPVHAAANVAQERVWQASHLPAHLREEVMGRIIVEEHKGGVKVTIRKGEGY